MFRFTIRELVLLTVVVVLWVAWWIDHGVTRARERMAQDHLVRLGSQWANEVNHEVNVDFPNDGRSYSFSPGITPADLSAMDNHP